MTGFKQIFERYKVIAGHEKKVNMKMMNDGNHSRDTIDKAVFLRPNHTFCMSASVCTGPSTDVHVQPKIGDFDLLKSIFLQRFTPCVVRHSLSAVLSRSGLHSVAASQSTSFTCE